MMRSYLLALCFSLTSLPLVYSQNYTSYFTGDTSDVTTSTSNVAVLMGGATENDSAMVWFLEHSGGGDIVVLRASGSNGYNAYMYSQLGVSVNSVETIVCNSAAASNDPYVIQQVRHAEALWFAGGNQWDYVSYWNNTPIDTAINYLINVKKVPVGGTSAGMAILGHIVNTAQNGSATSAASLANPYTSNITLLKDDFVFHPWLNNVVTDTHYDNPDRRGRHVAFMARTMQDYAVPEVYGIACNEYVAVCIDTNGLARVYGDYPNYQEFAYFLQANCLPPNTPELCTSGQPLQWDRNGEAVKVYQVPGTPSGSNWFQLSNWNTGSGGNWQNWSVTNGVLQVNAQAQAPNCNATTPVVEWNAAGQSLLVFPNPVQEELNFNLNGNYTVEIFDLFGKSILRKVDCTSSRLDVSELSHGCYVVVATTATQTFRTRIVKL